MPFRVISWIAFRSCVMTLICGQFDSHVTSCSTSRPCSVADYHRGDGHSKLMIRHNDWYASSHSICLWHCIVELDLNNPPTSVGGIQEFGSAHGRPDLNNPPTAVRGISAVLTNNPSSASSKAASPVTG